MRIHNDSGLTTPDGMPMVWAGRRAGATQMDRVYGPDLMLALAERAAARGWRSFFYGGKEGVADTLVARLQANVSRLHQSSGTYSPPFRPLTPEEDAAIVERINASGAELVWVGLSTPKQERWMAAHVGRLQAAGAARRRRRVRHPRRDAAAGAALDAAARAGVGLSPVARAASSVAPLPVQQPALPAGDQADAAATAPGSPAGRSARSAMIRSTIWATAMPSPTIDQNQIPPIGFCR